MASIKRLPNGKWQARYRDEHGVQRTRRFTTRVDADHWVVQVAGVRRGDSGTLDDADVDALLAAVVGTAAAYREHGRSIPALRGEADRLDRLADLLDDSSLRLHWTI